MPRITPTAVTRLTVGWRRLVARRPWVHWVLVAALAAATAAEVSSQLARVESARRAWGATTRVVVADGPHAPGEPVTVRAVEVPEALVPAGAADPGAFDPARGGAPSARQRIGDGEIVTVDDIAGGGPLALVPDGWLAVPLVESPPSGAAIGDRVTLVSEGVVIAAEALVVGGHDDVTLVAVRAEEAPLVPAAAAAGSVVVLRSP